LRTDAVRSAYNDDLLGPETLAASSKQTTLTEITLQIWCQGANKITILLFLSYFVPGESWLLWAAAATVLVEVLEVRIEINDNSSSSSIPKDWLWRLRITYAPLSFASGFMVESKV
jgi:hypothetical protein